MATGEALSSSMKLLIVSFSETSTDPRVKRQVTALNQHFKVTIAGFGEYESSGTHFVQLKRLNERGTKFGSRVLEFLEFSLAIFRLYTINYWWAKPEVWALARLLKTQNFDVIVANEPETIPIVLSKSTAGTAVVHDQHEYWPDLFINKLKRRVVSGYRMWLMTKYARHVTHWSVVGLRIGNEYQRNAGMPEPVVISNASHFHELEPSSVDPDRVELIHHGLWDPGRGVEKIIDALSLTDHSFHLNLMLINAPIDILRKLATDKGVADRVHFHPAVPQDQVSEFINQFDVEVIFIQPVNKNFQLALPNKLFEAIQGRLAIVSSPLPEVAEIVTEHGVGLVSDGFDPKSLASTLESLSIEDIRRMKVNTNAAAQAHSAEANAERLVALIQQAIKAVSYSRERTRET